MTRPVSSRKWRSPSLQWGRGLSAAEMRNLCTALPGERATLQWGRGLSAAEMRGRAGEPGRSRAASMGPRPFSRGNYQDEYERRNKVCQLQWGRGLSAAEIAIPTTLSRGVLSGFNGAAAFQPRKSEPPEPEPEPPEPASMGPRPFSRGNRPFRWRSTCAARELQWGRGLSAAEIYASVLIPWHRIQLQWGRGLSAAEISQCGW